MNPSAHQLELARWLTSAAAAPYLAPGQIHHPSPADVARLRRELTATQASALLTQHRLRSKARAKFPAADQLFYLERHLEQATDATTAAYKAQRFPAGEPVADLCCGIGGDALALASRSPVTLIDADPVAAHFATVNVERQTGQRPSSHSRFIHPDDLRGVAAWHIDPDRRPQGRRTTSPEFHAPALAEIDAWRIVSPHAAIKLAPAAKVPDAWLAESEAEWIACDGTCRALVLWFGRLTPSPGTRRATVLTSRRLPDGRLLPPVPTVECLRTFAATGGVERAPHSPPAAYIYDPSAAIVAARLVDHLAAEHRLNRLTSDNTYLTSDRLVDDPALSPFEVLETLPLDLKRLKAHLAARGVGQLELKQRGTGLDLQKLARQLAVPGDRRAVVLFAATTSGRAAIVARRVGAP